MIHHDICRNQEAGFEACLCSGIQTYPEEETKITGVSE